MSLSKLELELRGVRVLEIAGVDDEGRPLIRMSADDGPAPARTVWMPHPPDWAACRGLRAVVAVEEGGGPIILGLLDPPPDTDEADVPTHLRIDSREELVIQCGKSKIAMRADGRIEIRGGHLISRSSGPNKIKGGSVHIN